MLVENQMIEVGIGGINYNHYKNLGYDLSNYRKLNPFLILVPLEHLTEGSHAQVSVVCDYCGKIFTKSYKGLLNERKTTYIKKDSCSGCSYLKLEERNMEMYGYSNNFTRPEIIEQIKKTNLERYGVEYVSQNKEIAAKSSYTQRNMSEERKKDRELRTKKTTMERYGVPHYTQTEEYIEKKKRTSLEKYGTENFAESDIVRNKYRETCLEKYGADNYFGSSEFKEYIQEYWMEREGVNHWSKTNSYKDNARKTWANMSEEKLKQKYDKTKDTVMKKYGVEFVLQLANVRKTLYNKMGYPTSRKQALLYEIIKTRFPDALENIEFPPYLIDILISTKNCDILVEYDCFYWHISQTDIRKNDFFLSKGYKILRIKSGKYMPDEKLLFEKIYSLLDTDSKYEEIYLNDWNEDLYQLKSKGIRK